MKLNLRFVAAAVAVMTAGVAHATITESVNNFAGDGNSSLLFVAYDKVGTPISITADLGFMLDDFRAAGAPGQIFDGTSMTDGFLGSASTLANTPGSTISWNFNNNTTTINGVVSTSTNGKANTWSAKTSAYYALAQNSETKWGIVAADTTSYYEDGASVGAPVASSGLYQDSTEILTTADPLQLDFNLRMGLTHASNVNAGAGSVQSFMHGLVLNDSSTAAQNGAVVATAGFPYAGAASFNGNWGANFMWSAVANEGTAQNLYQLNDAPLDPLTLALNDTPYVTKFPGTFTYAAGVLTYAVPTVPEPGSVALVLAGLAVVAGVSRRRAAK